MVGSKKILLVGGGGREHTLAWKLSQSENVSHIYALPGSVGIADVKKVELVKNVDINDNEAVSGWCKSIGIDMVVVGPEQPLVNGLGDALKKEGILCFGPGKIGARIESNKSWAKDFMMRHEIPTARFESFTDAEKAKNFIRNAKYDALVVKASGLAAGKGVIVAPNQQVACEAVDQILKEKIFGTAGDVVVIEELLEGEEVSCLAFVDATTVRMMLPAQDHKRIGDGDTGPNTGGMGAYCPCPLISKDTLADVCQNVLQKAVDGLRAEGIEYCGVLYAGIMLTQNGPKTLEYNCRFGDPETQVILPLLDTDLYEIMEACCTNTLSTINLQWKPNTTAVCVVMASLGYPETATKGCVITGIDNVDSSSGKHFIFHSGVSKNDTGSYVTNGGRVLNNVVLSDNLKNAAEEATTGCSQIKFDGAQYRTDIARKGYKPTLTYKTSGVNIDSGDALVQRIKPLARGTHRPGVIGGLGGFGGLFRLNDVKYTDHLGNEQPYRDPVLVQGTDGVGTKLKIALALEIYDTIGIDLVAMCANDVVCVGAEPLAFLDYIACGKLDIPVAAQLVKGISEACREVNCALLGGETAEMPTLYKPGKYDLAGYCVGVVENDQILPRMNEICAGDLVIGFPSSGLHSNGFSLVNKLMEINRLNLRDIAPFSVDKFNYGQEFLKPTRLYVADVLPMIRQGTVKALAHITGGGLLDNIPRVLPNQLGVEIDGSSFEIPSVFGWIAAIGNVTEFEMLRTFNCGIGMVMIVPASDTTYNRLAMKSGAIRIGHVVNRSTASEQVIVKNFQKNLNSCADKFRKSDDKVKALTTSSSVSYKDSGVDITAGDSLVQKIKTIAKSTDIPGVVGGIGGFSGLFRVSDFKRIDEYTSSKQRL